MFKTGFRVQNHLLNLFSSAVNSQRLFYSEKLVGNVRIKAFWFTNEFVKRTKYLDNLSNFVLKEKYFNKYVILQGSVIRK